MTRVKQPCLIVQFQPNKSADLVAAVNKLNIPVYLSSMARGLLGRESKCVQSLV
jgi:hypothetical protein